MKFIFIFLFLPFIAGSFTACNYTRLKQLENVPNFGPLEPNEKLTLMNYEYISSRILQPKCASCHGTSGDINLENYGNVIAHLGGVQKSVFQEQTMPKRGTLSLEEKRLLWNWIALGAPKTSTMLPPDPEPLLATYDSIDRQIFQTRCVTCHNPQDSGKRILLDRVSLMESPLELVIPGNSDESGLVISVEREGDKRMPPAKDGYSPLKSEEKAVIREWINAGAKN